MEVLLVADAGKARDQYVGLLEAFGARPRVAVDPVALMESLRDGEFGGIMFDEPTLLQDGRYDMGLLRGLCERYPVLHVMFDPDSGTLHALGSRHYASCREGILEFLGECRDFMSIRLRGGARQDVCLPVLLSRDFDDAAAGVEQVVTRNISRFGCFLTTVSPWERGEQIWLVFEDVDPRPVRARVAWRQRWGERRPPGLGVWFLAPHEALLAEVACLEAAARDQGTDPVTWENAG